MSDTNNIFPTYAKFNFEPVRGKGCYLYDSDDKEYLDFYSGVGVNSLGHCHEQLVSTLTQQAKKMWHVSNIYHISPQEELAKNICAKSFGEKVFFTNSGAEALECCIKTARKYYSNSKTPKNRIITFKKSFHGRTLATISASNNNTYLEGFSPKLEGFDNLPIDKNAVADAVTTQHCAIIIEPILGEGGVHVVDKEFLQFLRDLCDKNDMALIFDEVQCGMGRTGDLFAYQTFGVTPDIMALAKGMGGGFPIGACVTTNKIASSMSAGTHGTTYGGNPLATAVANKVLDIISNENFLSNIKNTSLNLSNQLEKLQNKFPNIITEIRGMGLMIGIELNPKINNVSIIKKLLESSLLCIGAGDNVIRLLPPLIITNEQINYAMDIIDNVLASENLDNL